MTTTATNRLMDDPEGRVRETVPSGSPEVLLVVDDLPENRDVLARRLRRAGYAVATAENGAAALRLVAEQEISLVLLDITMPEMGGGDVLRALRVRNPELLVTLMSGFTEAETRSELEHDGYFGFLQKPFSLDALRAAVDALLVRR